MENILSYKQLINRFYTKKKSVGFIIFNSSEHKNNFGTVMLVQMQLSSTLSDQNKTLKKPFVSLTKSSAWNQR